MNSKRYYLATTGFSEIWDLESNLLLLGPWCVTSKKNKEVILGKDYLIVPSPWKPAYKIKEAAGYCYAIYEELLPRLSEALNSIHKVAYPQRYWSILVGPWLLHFIGVFYDRYMRIEHAFKLFPDLYTNILPIEKCKISSTDTFDFLRNKVNEDYYNLRLFSLIAYDVCPDKIQEVTDNIQLKTDTKQLISNSFKGRLFNRFLKTVNLVFRGSIILSDMYHLTPSDMFRLKLRSRMDLLSFINFNYTGISLKDNFSPEFRKRLNIKGANCRFSSLLYRILPEALPVCYMENYRLYKSKVGNLDLVKTVGSAVGWDFNESFKFFAAEAASKGANTIDFQHGGNYGFSMSIPSESISLEKDIFYTWGWSLEKNNKTKPLPNPYLSAIKDTHSERYNKLLFIGVTMPRYQYRFHTLLLPDDMPMYFEEKKIFLTELSGKIKDKILYRPYYDLGWAEKEFIRDICPSVKFLTGTRIIKWLRQVKLVIIDHPHTSFIEALTVNVPCIFFWDFDVYLIRPEAEHYFELLINAGIIYRDPVDAAKKVNEVFDNPRNWWLSREVQDARTKFCQRFAYGRKDWVDIWVKELRQI